MSFNSRVLACSAFHKPLIELNNKNHTSPDTNGQGSNITQPRFSPLFGYFILLRALLLQSVSFFLLPPLDHLLAVVIQLLKKPQQHTLINSDKQQTMTDNEFCVSSAPCGSVCSYWCVEWCCQHRILLTQMKNGLLLDVRTAASHGLISRVQLTGFSGKFEHLAVALGH